jgi:Tfp pilus assembly protein PilV
LRSQAGFSLLEVVLAFVMAGLVLGIALPAMSQTIPRLIELRSHSTAVLLAHSKLEEYSIDGVDIPRNNEGTQGEFFWRVDVEDILPDGMEGPMTGIYGLQRISVTIARDAHSAPLVRMSAHRFRK